jgi:hypothetical protein
LKIVVFEEVLEDLAWGLKVVNFILVASVALQLSVPHSDVEILVVVS